LISFQGQTAVVTGGTRGIGARLVADLRDAGAKVLATGTDRVVTERMSRAAEAQGWTVRYEMADFSTRDGICAFADLLAEVDVDVLINNAGINRINDISRVPEEDWDMVRSVNLDAPVLLTKAVAEGMRKRAYGRIVNIGSIFGVVSRAKRAPYSVTKSGLHGLTRATALDLAGDGVLVNTLSPGFVKTDLTEQVLGAEGMARLKDDIPMGRLAEPSDISPVVIFLASGQNTYLTGQNVVVDGGFTSA
jgi:3-oxoacyl-[acyl-carrier protein] reductase